MQAHAAAYASLSDSYLSNGAASGLQTSSTTAAGLQWSRAEAADIDRLCMPVQAFLLASVGWQRALMACEAWQGADIARLCRSVS